MRKPPFVLQQEILAVLEQWPSYEAAHAANPSSLNDWALPRHIIRALGLPKAAATRATVSRALLGLYQRGLVARAAGELAEIGKSFRYLRITDPANAGAGNNGPSTTLGTSRSHVKGGSSELTHVRSRIRLIT